MVKEKDLQVAKMGLRMYYQSAICLCSLAAVLGCCLGEVATQITVGMEDLTKFGTDERILIGDVNISEPVSALSARTRRVDPLNSFKKYKGGYNITSTHYWSSTIYTGRYGYIIGAIWIIGGLVYASILLITRTHFINKEPKHKKRFPFSDKYCVWPILIGVILAFLAIVPSGIVLGGSVKFCSRAKTIKNIIMETSEEAAQTIYNVTGAVEAMGTITEFYGGFKGSNYLNSTSQKLIKKAANIQRKAETSMLSLNKGIKILEAVTITSIVLNIVAVLAVLALRQPRLYKIFYLFIILCWLFTFLFWIYFGLYFFLYKFSGDSCVALAEYTLHPRNSNLSSIMPCSEQLSANAMLRDIRAGIHNTIDQVNKKISAAKSLPIPDLEFVCNPFSETPDYSYEPKNCSSNTIKIGDIPQILKKYTCMANDRGVCRGGELISASDFMKVQVYTSSMQNILDGYPGIERLANCQLVKDASKILLKECKPLRNYAYSTWAASVVLSIFMVFFVLMLIVEAHQQHKRLTSHCSVVQPQPGLEGSQMDMIAL
ncbi:hypothetical protein OPV22_031088 [Ensete ventricosum]|uniref:Uncharacterized protein n=1 Tax=Ensete ventricosum TaxID=4639 RepID=A0AAV8PKF1_ENSVE|nr:hypothetical protein OPV22_031088 [Ensete ventricosum]